MSKLLVALFAKAGSEASQVRQSEIAPKNPLRFNTVAPGLCLPYIVTGGSHHRLMSVGPLGLERETAQMTANFRTLYNAVRDEPLFLD